MENATRRIAHRICDGAVGLLTTEELENFGEVHETTARPIVVEIQGWVDEKGVPIHELFNLAQIGPHPAWLSVKRYQATKEVRPDLSLTTSFDV